MTTDGVLISRDMLAFLCGDGPLDGHYFGEKPEHERGNFWWRKHLREAEKAALEQAGEPVDVCADAQFLIDRLSELEWADNGYADVVRDFFGHVEPAMARLKASLRDADLSTLQRLGQEFDGEEGLGEALFALSDRLRSTGWLELPDNHAAYEKVVAAFQSLSEAREAGDSLAAGDRV